MSCFLWVEDFAFGEQTRDIKSTAEKLFGGIYPPEAFHDNERNLKTSLKKYHTFLELNFQDALKFINTRLHDVDYVILDIDLPAYGEHDEIEGTVLSTLKDFESYIPSDDPEDETRQKSACNRLKVNAGFYLYSKLVFELGFPKQHIQFFSNHGKEFKSIEDAFKAAKITPPEIFLKSDVGIRKWIASCFDSPYSRLRRGIIEACRYLKSLPEERYRFDKLLRKTEKPSSVDDDYLVTLENFLPLREPKEPAFFYRLLVRTLAHEWDVADPELIKNQNKKNGSFAFSWIMKMTRNWSAHSKIFEQLEARDVAYLFIVNMRAMFELNDEVLPYEEHLFELFNISYKSGDFKKIIGDHPKNYKEQGYKERKLPLVESYAALLDKTGNTLTANSFHRALNKLQEKQKEKSIENDFLIQGLYQTFWFLTSNGEVFIPYKNDKIDMEAIRKFSNLNYRFKYFDYSKSNFIFELASHIYHPAFEPEAYKS
jgi:hypothetical protein